MSYRDVYGMTVYAQAVQPRYTDYSLLARLRLELPALMGMDPDDYRTTRELVFSAGRLIYVVALGERRDKTLWYAVMAVGATVVPPPEYVRLSQAVGEAAVELAAHAGDFDDEGAFDDSGD